MHWQQLQQLEGSLLKLVPLGQPADLEVGTGFQPAAVPATGGQLRQERPEAVRRRVAIAARANLLRKSRLALPRRRHRITPPTILVQVVVVEEQGRQCLPHVPLDVISQRTQNQVVIENPIINSPLSEPTRRFRFSDEGITNEIVEGRRVNSYFVPIARPRKKSAQSSLFATEWTEGRIEENKIVNIAFPDLLARIQKDKLVKTKSKNFANVLRRTLATSRRVRRVGRGTYAVR